MDPEEDPTTTVFNNGTPDGINTEHSYPRSKGADEGNARADMHHLFPTRVDVNGIRASHPFEEIPDEETTNWYYDDINTTMIPNEESIDLYSEYRNGGFEPRESFKGNIARAAFYFYSIYREEANEADPEFFHVQKEDLCEWHYEDPVDEEEWLNTFKIALYQEGIPNPFVLDCRLARLYCTEISAACGLVSNNNPSTDYFAIYPNPASNYIHFDGFTQNGLIEVFNLNGQKLIHQKNSTNTLDIHQLPNAIIDLYLH